MTAVFALMLAPARMHITSDTFMTLPASVVMRFSSGYAATNDATSSVASGLTTMSTAFAAHVMRSFRADDVISSRTHRERSASPAGGLCLSMPTSQQLHLRTRRNDNCFPTLLTAHWVCLASRCHGFLVMFCLLVRHRKRVAELGGASASPPQISARRAPNAADLFVNFRHTNVSICASRPTVFQFLIL